MVSRRFYCTAFLLGLHAGQVGLLAATPKGLSDSDWSAIQKEHTRHRQAAIAVDGGWRARNIGQDWSTYFDGRGFEITPARGSWHWGLRLTAYGYPGRQQRVSGAQPAADVEKFAYQWDSNLREWYVNGEGLEHGYTLSARPGEGHGLQFDLEVRGTLRTRIAADGKSVSFVDKDTGGAVVNYSGLKVTDASGRELAAHFEKKATGLRLVVDDGEAQYPITVDPLVQQATLTASNAEAGDGFGFSVAIDGDFLVVGAPLERSNGSSETDNSLLAAGAVYLFYHAPSGWTQVTYIKAQSPAPPSNLSRFGYAVGISGTRIVVGAPERTGTFGGQTRTASGGAYVFKIEIPICAPNCLAYTVSQEAYLEGFFGTSVSPRAGDRFGWSVAIGRDSVSPDGDKIVVGSPRYDGIGESPFVDSGAAFVFARSGTAWTVQRYLESPLPLNGGFFGYSVAVSGSTAVIGEPQNGAITFGGRAHVYTLSGGVWSQQATLAASNPDAFDSFGWAVGIDGDNAVVGAPFEDGDGTAPTNNSRADSGAVYLFSRSGTAWSPATYFKAPNSVSNERFGSYVTISADTWVAGAPGGRLFAYRSGVREPLTILSNGIPITNFGDSAAVSAGTVLVGSVSGGAGAGAAYIFAEGTTLVSISISTPLTTIPKGTTAQFTAIGTYSDGSTANLTTQVSWKSENLAIATISAPGLVTGAAVGFSNISATLNGVTSNAVPLVVGNAALVSIQISAGSTHVAGGATLQFQAVGTYTDGSTANVVSQVAWNSTNSAAVTISLTGLVTGVSFGSSTITAKLNGVTSNSVAITVDCATDITSQVRIAPQVFRYNFATGGYVEQVLVTNLSLNAYTGPIALVVDNLSQGVTLSNVNGTVHCNLPSAPYVNLNTAAIAPGQTVTFTLQFTNPSGGILYVPRVLAGPLPR